MLQFPKHVVGESEGLIVVLKGAVQLFLGPSVRFYFFLLAWAGGRCLQLGIYF